MATIKRNEMLAHRLVNILTKLNNGERVDTQALAEEFNVSVRTIQRDLSERFSFLNWSEKGPRYYSMEQRQFGLLNRSDIERFARFASISELFPTGEREFFQEKLSESVQVKGFSYEDIRSKRQEFELLKKAIENRQYVQFFYQKNNESQGKSYRFCPYSLINKNGIWYLIGMSENKKKTFCFSQISMLSLLSEKFDINQQFLLEIEQSDSIYYGNQLKEIVVKVNKEAAHYFTRRNLLPNQTLLHRLDDGGILLMCENVNEREVIPLVQYWIPDVSIISPSELQDKLIENLKNYISQGVKND